MSGDLLNRPQAEELTVPEIQPDTFVDLLTGFLLPLATLGVLLLGVWIANRTLMRSVTPQVECFLRPRPGSQTFELVLANYGMGSAYNVSLSLEADAADFEAHRVFISISPTELPFSILEPNGSVTTSFGMGHHLLKNEPYLKPFKAEVKYEWQPFWAKNYRKVKRTYNMDVRPFKGLIYSPKKDKVAEELKRGLKIIADALKVRPRLPIPRDRRSDDRRTLERMESLMPSLFAEMREDLIANPLKREFIVMSKSGFYGAGEKEPLGYYYESHEDMPDKVGLLVSEGLVTDITYNHTDRYVFSEPLVEYLLGSQEETEDGSGEDSQPEPPRARVENVQLQPPEEESK